jgi:hypothetical protein
MVHGSYEELEWEPRETLLDQGPRLGPNPVNLKPDEDLDLVCIFLAQADGLCEVCSFVSDQGGFGVTGFDLMSQWCGLR